MTQMELAEEMSVSFQAVSSWERGSTMPDISRLPQLCDTLGISIDQLLDNSPYLPTMEQLLEPGETITEPIPAQHLVELEPVIKPKELSSVIHHNKEGVLFDNFYQLLNLIPFYQKRIQKVWYVLTAPSSLQSTILLRLHRCSHPS